MSAPKVFSVLFADDGRISREFSEPHVSAHTYGARRVYVMIGMLLSKIGLAHVYKNKQKC